MEEETVLKNRLALDDRPVKQLHKKISNWVENLPFDSVEAARATFDTLLVQISSFKTNMRRQPLIQRANDQDISKYGFIVEDTAKIVSSASGDISFLREELKEAQKVRDHKLEYDKVAREIMKLKTRDAYHDSIDKLKADIEFLKQEKESRERALASRRAEFAKMVKSVKDLQRAINEERALAEENRKRVMDMDHGYESSDDEGSSTGSREQTPEPERVGTSHRFQERDDDDDEEGMVPDGDDAAIVVNGMR